MQETTSEIIMMPASAKVEGQSLVWAFSKKQLDMVLQDIVGKTSKSAGDEGVGRAEWRDLELPIVSFEKYYGLEQKKTALLPKYCVVKGAYEHDGKSRLVRIAVEINSNIKALSCGFKCTPLSTTVLPKRACDVLGVFQLQAGVTMIIPDIAKIWENTNLGFYPE